MLKYFQGKNLFLTQNYFEHEIKENFNKKCLSRNLNTHNFKIVFYWRWAERTIISVAI